MENQPIASEAASLGDISLDAYRATREAPRTSAVAVKPADKPVAAAAPQPSESSPGTPAAASVDGDEIELDAETGTPILEQDGTPKRSTHGYKKTIVKLRDRISELEAARLAAPPAAAPAAAAAPAVARPSAAAPALPAFATPKPLLEDFATIEEHTDAAVTWALDKRDFERAASAKAETIKVAADKLLTAWTDRVTDFKAENDDYDAVVKAADKVKLSNDLQRVILESEAGPAIAYELASGAENDYAELRRIAALSPLNAAREVGKIEARLLGAHPVPHEKPVVSGAPRPIRPVGARAGASAPDVAKMSHEDYRAARESGRLT
jgi:hypothetical protein